MTKAPFRQNFRVRTRDRAEPRAAVQRVTLRSSCVETLSVIAPRNTGSRSPIFFIFLSSIERQFAFKTLVTTSCPRTGRTFNRRYDWIDAISWYALRIGSESAMWRVTRAGHGSIIVWRSSYGASACARSSQMLMAWHSSDTFLSRCVFRVTLHALFSRILQRAEVYTFICHSCVSTIPTIS